MPRYKIERNDIIREEETQGMIDSTTALKDKAMISFLYLFGVRPAEMYTLKRENFSLKETKLCVDIITKKKRLKKGVSPILIYTRHLWTPLSEPISRYILQYLESCDYSVPIFQYGKTDKSANVIIDRKIKSVNPNCCAYIFRHSRNTVLGESGATETQLMAWNGWSDGRPAGRYIHHTARLIDGIPQGKD